MELDRRDFLKGTVATSAAVVAGLSATGVALADEAEEEAEEEVEDTEEAATETEYPDGLIASDFDESPVVIDPITDYYDEKTYDVVVVGAGTSGIPAAMAAAEEGASVAVLQKNSIAVSQGGGFTGVLLDQSDDQGIMNYLQGYLEECHWRADRGLAETWVYHSGEAVRWLQVRSAEAGFPPYKDPTPYETDYDDGTVCVRRTIDFGPKPLNNGDLMQAMAELAAQEGVDFYYSTPGVQLITDDSGAVTGVYGEDSDGYIKFNATNGVILATGDYQNNESLVERYCPDVKEFDKKQYGKTGDGILMAMAIGAGFVPVGHAHMMHDFDSGPMSSQPFLAVNDDGERFMNEDCTFEEINNVLRYEPNPGWYSQIFDDNYEEQVEEWGGSPTDKETLQKYMPEVEMDRSVESGLGVYEDLIDTYTADTLEELAEKLGIPSDALVSSVERYNEMCDAGYDSDFGKNPTYLKKIETAPFYGIHKHVRVSALCAGVTVNENYQVTTADGELIPNLWATGFGAGQLCGMPDWSMYQVCMSCGSCLTSGRICGIQAATGGSLEPTTPITEEDVEAIYAESESEDEAEAAEEETAAVEEAEAAEEEADAAEETEAAEEEADAAEETAAAEEESEKAAEEEAEE